MQPGCQSPDSETTPAWTWTRTSRETVRILVQQTQAPENVRRLGYGHNGDSIAASGARAEPVPAVHLESHTTDKSGE